MSDTHPSAETIGALSAVSTPARLGAGLWRHRKPAGVAVVVIGAVGAVLGVLLGEHGPAVLAGVVQVARLGWPAVALVVSLVAFASMLRVVAAVLGAVQLLVEQLRASEVRAVQTSTAIVRIEENQERMTIVLDRLVERTQPGTGAPVTFPPAAPQRA